MKKINQFLMLALLALNVSLLNAQESADELGIYSLFQIHSHSADFGKLPDVPGCCPSYDGGSGNGFAAGLFWQSSINETFNLQIRLGMNFIGGEMTKEEYIGNTYDENMNTVEALSEHKLTTNLSVFELTPMITAKPFGFPLFFNLGVQAGYIAGGTYEQSENLVSPSVARFIDGSTSRNNFDGDIEKLSSLFFAGYASLNYKIKITKNLNLYPEAGYSLNFNELAENTPWKVNSIRIGALLSYELTSPPPPLVPDIEPPPPVKRTSLTAKVNAVGVDEENVEKEIAIFKVEEFLSRQLYPLLPYVFFDENSSVIPPKYIRISQEDADRFNPQTRFTSSETMDVYYNLLNIIGLRMRNNPAADVVLTGCNSNQGRENGNEALSRKRAESVKEYLIDRWKINPGRITVVSRNLPENYTEQRSEAHNQENRRVEIFSDNPEITKPVFIYDTLRLTTPPKIKIRMDAEAEAGIFSWEMSASQMSDKGRKELISTNGFAVPDSIYLWNPAKSRSSIPRTEKPLEIQYTVTDNNDTSLTTSSSMPVEQITIRKKLRRKIDDKYIDHYRIIMFDFDKPQVLKQHKEVLEIVCENVTPQSTIVVTGYTDELGAESYNKELSEQRAAKMAEALPCSGGKTESRGRGETQLHDNDTPEGRFYNRTVLIKVETPVER